MNLDEDKAIKIVNAVTIAQKKRLLNDRELLVLRASWHGTQYQDMKGWDKQTLKDTGSELWKCLSQALDGEIKVTKNTLRQALISLSKNPRYNGTIEVDRLTMPTEKNSFSYHPFGDRGCITNPARFYDREDILRRVFEGLQRGCSQSLVGKPEIGKSSILTAICNRGHQILPHHTFIFLDLECIHNEDDFFNALCDEIGLDSTCRGHELRRKVRDRHYIICLDEVEGMTKPAKFSGSERSELRGLAGSPTAPFTLVTASRSPLSQLFPDSPEKMSPLANIFTSIEVKPFSPDIAKKFITHRLQETDIVFTEQQINDLLNESQGHPAHLQKSAKDLYDRLLEQ